MRTHFTRTAHSFAELGRLLANPRLAAMPLAAAAAGPPAAPPRPKAAAFPSRTPRAPALPSAIHLNSELEHPRQWTRRFQGLCRCCGSPAMPGEDYCYACIGD